MQVNPKITKIPLNATGGVMTLIVCTIQASRVEIIEDPNYNAGVQQGLTGYRMDPNSTQANPARDAAGLFIWLPNGNGQQGEAFEPIIFGGDKGRVHGAFGEYVGAAGTPILQLTTNSANAGGILLAEWV